MREVVSWRNYHRASAYMASTRSKDPNTQVGCVLVDPITNHQLVSGYNGFLAQVTETPEMWERPTKYDHVVHAEANAIAFAAKKGIPLHGSHAYVTALPCLNCMKLLIASGIAYIFADSLLHGWDEDHRKSKLEARNAHIPVDLADKRLSSIRLDV